MRFYWGFAQGQEKRLFEAKPQKALGKVVAGAGFEPATFGL
jgi:hypothetical protein